MRYFPNNGTTNEVGGIISTTSKKNTWRLIRIDIDNVTYNKNPLDYFSEILEWLNLWKQLRIGIIIVFCLNYTFLQIHEKATRIRRMRIIVYCPPFREELSYCQFEFSFFLFAQLVCHIFGQKM